MINYYKSMNLPKINSILSKELQMAYLASDMKSGVIFYDYDGTILYYYTVEKFLSLASMPMNPVHTGLISQGWNWPLTEAKKYVSKHGKLEIGQSYITSDGSTRLYARFGEKYLSTGLHLLINTSAIIAWGDNTFTTLSESDNPLEIDQNGYTRVFVEHVYPNAGEYVISIRSLGTSSNGRIILKETVGAYYEDISKSCFLQKVELGSGISLGESAFANCYSLVSISIPKKMSFSNGFIFDSCYGLKCVVIPEGGIRLGNGTFTRCKSLKTVCLPYDLQRIGAGCFQIVNQLLAPCIPDSVEEFGRFALSTTSISSGHNDSTSFHFPEDFNMDEICSAVFENNYHLTNISIPEGVLTINEGAFRASDLLKQVFLPYGLTIIGKRAFAECHSLIKINFPSTLTRINEAAFYECGSLGKIVFSENIEVIEQRAFEMCISLTKIYFKGNTPPHITNINAWDNVPSICVIYVPRGTKDLYTSTDNMPNPKKYRYEEYGTISLSTSVNENVWSINGTGVKVNGNGTEIEIFDRFAYVDNRILDVQNGMA